MMKYMTVQHHEDTHLKVVGNTIEGRVPVHDLMANYYWARLDADHILLYGSHSLSTHKALHDHPKAVVLPFLHHRKTLKEHYVQKDKLTHHSALAKNLALDDDATMQEFVDAVIAKHGAIFAPKL
jgi:hypothetical protein